MCKYRPSKIFFPYSALQPTQFILVIDVHVFYSIHSRILLSIVDVGTFTIHAKSYCKFTHRIRSFSKNVN